MTTVLGLTLALVAPSIAQDCGGCEKEKANQAKDGGCCEGEKAAAGDKNQVKGDDCGDCCGSATVKTSPELEKVKSLAGEWETAPDKDGNSVKVIYKVTSNGTAVTETIMPGTSHEMVTIYHLDCEGKLMLTHYCAMGNQPRMRVTKVEGSTMMFDFVDGTNCIPAKGFMGQLKLTITDAEHAKAEWTVLKDGKPAQSIAFDFVKSSKQPTKATK